MLEVFLVFCYMTITCFIMGFALFTIFNKIVPNKQLNAVSIIFMGIIFMTVYAQFYSLFSGVGLMANVLLVSTCVAVSIILRKQLLLYLSKILHETSVLYKIILLFIMMLFAFGTSHGYIHYDTSLYHAQAIRWIEEFGILKGLGNVYIRLAYNSSAFALTALYSMSFMAKNSLHCAAGYMAFLLLVLCLEPLAKRKVKRLIVADFARIAAIYYLMNIFDEMVSPASDYFTLITIFYIIIRWLDLLEEKETSPYPYGFLCVMGVYAITLKLSAAFILLLTIKPMIMLIKEKKIWQSITFILLGIITICPYFIRNVIISGYLIYPFSSIDIFNVDWKMPSSLANNDAREIQVWGKGLNDVSLYDTPFLKWFPHWFLQQTNTDRLLISVALIATLLACFYCLSALVHKNFDIPLVFLTLVISFLFWFFNAPLFRYGCVYVYLTAAVVFGYFYVRLFPKRHIILYVSLMIIICYKSYAFDRELYSDYDNKYLVYQEDYENYRVDITQVGGYRFFKPYDNDRTGYDNFPVTHNLGGFALRGTDIKDGFKPLETKPLEITAMN